MSRIHLTAAQAGIWWGQALDPASPAYQAAEYLELNGGLDVAAFERAVQLAFLEAEALWQRVYENGGQLWQEPLPSRAFELQHLDLRGEGQRAAQDWMRQDLATPPELERGRLFATALLRLADEQWLWYLRVHHVALDGFGFALLERRVADVYAELERGRTPVLEPLPRLCELAEDDAAYRRSGAFERDRAFWLSRLRSAPQPVLLSPPCELANGVARHRTLLAPETFDALQACSKALGVDVAACVAAGMLAWHGSATGAEQQTLGFPVAGRLGSVGARLPSMMMNILALRLDWSDAQSFAELARLMASELRAVRPHQRYRYEDLKRDLAPVAPGRRLFGPLLNWMPFEPPARFGSLRAVKRPLHAGPVEDWAVIVAPAAGGCRLELEANPNAYSESELAQHAEGLARTWLELARAPGASFRSPSSQRRAVSVLEAPAVTMMQDILQSIQTKATESGSCVAVEQVDGALLTYAQLVEQASRLAGRLGAGEPDRLVAILLPRSLQAVVAQVAVLWSGAAYLPLDPDGPAERLAYVLADAQPRIIITLAAYAGRCAGLPTLLLDDDSAVGACVPCCLVPPNALAYVIYTSGSTGSPQGVMVERGALQAFVSAACERYGMTRRDRVLQFAPLHFDASVEEIWTTLASGGTLVLRSAQMLESMSTFLAACRRLSLSVLDLPTAFWHELVLALDEVAQFSQCLRLLIIGGEAALADRVARFHRFAPPGLTLLNTYGPTETTVVCTVATLRQGDAPSIGGPIPGVTVAVVDAELRPVPRGEPGELCVLGPTLARGYLKRPESTAARFVTLQQLHGARAYRTGDRVLVSKTGDVQYLGRQDDELKLSGHRVSPLEVEAALLTLPGVQAAAVVAFDAGGGGKRLAAFIVPNQAVPSDATWREGLAPKLAAPAIPSRFMMLERLPLDANNKVDRKALAARAALDVPPVVQGSGALEQLVLSVWQEVLRTNVPDLECDFFQLGGTSLSALQVSQRLSRLLSRDVPLAALFREPTVLRLTRALSATEPSGPYLGQDPLAPLIALQPGTGHPLFCIHPADGLAWCYLGLAKILPETPIFGLQAPGMSGAMPHGFDELVSDYLALVRSVQARGPYHLLGWSSGGGIAHALACRLREQGESVGLVAMLDAYPSDMWRGVPEPTREDALVGMLDDLDASHVAPDGRRYTEEELLARLRAPGSSMAGFDAGTLQRMADVGLHSMRTYRTARHPLLDADVLFLRAAERPQQAPEPSLWLPYVAGRLDVHDVAAPHLGMCSPGALAQMQTILRQKLGRTTGGKHELRA